MVIAVIGIILIVVIFLACLRWYAKRIGKKRNPDGFMVGSLRNSGIV